MDAGASFDPKIRTKNKIMKRRTDYEQNNFYRAVREKRFQNAQKITLEIMNAVDIALLLSNLEDKERAFAFRLIPKDKAADVFSNMSNPIQSYLVKNFYRKRTS